MRITVCGAAGEVTGSGYLVETGEARVLVDFGMFQGRRATDARNRDLGPVEPEKLDAVVLTHAHLDHSGRLPLLEGLRAPVYATPATLDFTDLILRDSAHIQESDAERDSRRLRRAGRPPEAPLYRQKDVDVLRPRFRPLPYGELREVAPGVEVRFLDAGHILGSASVELRAEGKVVAFSGDVGPRGVPFLRDPELHERADLVFLESTYGGREHRPLDATVAEFQEIIERALAARSKVLIPSFAIGRAQLLLFYLGELIRLGRVPEFPIYLDSPMAIKATRLYAKHQRLFDAESKAMVASGLMKEGMRTVQFLETARESRRLNEDFEFGVVIAGAGMCNGGRILHHFKHHLWRKKTAVVFVGFQAPGTLGRRLVQGARHVRIYGDRIRVDAAVHTLGGFSAHAGQAGLLDWAAPLMPAQVALTHGEPDARDALAAALQKRFDVRARLPLRNETIEI